MVQKNRFVVSAFVLTASSLILNVIGMLFHVFLSQSLGTEGMGLFSLIFSVYNLAVTMATSSVHYAVTRLVAENMALNNHSRVMYSMRKCLIYSAVCSITACVALYASAPAISGRFLGDMRACVPLRILAPSLPFMALSSCFRGFFVAIRKSTKTVSFQLSEQFARMAVVTFGLLFFAGRGIAFACCVVVAGNLAGEMVSFGVAFVRYRREQHSVAMDRRDSKGIMGKILNICVPLAIGSYARSALTTVENMLVPKGLSQHGANRQTSLSQYGMVKGMALPLLTFPQTFLSSFSQLLIPEMAQDHAVGRGRHIQYVAGRVLQVTFLFSIIMSGVFFCFSQEYALCVYNNRELALPIRLLAPLVPLFYIDSVTDGILKGLNQQMAYLLTNLADAVLRVGLVFFLIPRFGLWGFIWMFYISNIFNTGMSILRLLQVTQVRVDFLNWLVKPLASMLISCLFMRYITGFFPLPPVADVIVKTVGALVLYCFWIRVLRSLSREDLQWFKSLLKKPPED